MIKIGIVLVPIVILVILIAGYFIVVTSPPLFPEKIVDRFVSTDRKTFITLENIERSLVGDETYIRAWVQDGEYRSESHVIDHNGRLRYSKDYFLYISRDRNWVRTCKSLRYKETGKLVWAPYEPDLLPRYERWMRGRWKVETLSKSQGGKDYSYKCDAYINFRSNLLIRMVYPHSTREQRESKLFAPKERGSLEDEIDGKKIVWERLIKQVGE